MQLKQKINVDRFLFTRAIIVRNIFAYMRTIIRFIWGNASKTGTLSRLFKINAASSICTENPATLQYCVGFDNDAPRFRQLIHTC